MLGVDRKSLGSVKRAKEVTDLEALALEKRESRQDIGKGQRAG